MTTFFGDRKLRIALGPMSEQWTGGLEYYRLLRAAFALLEPDDRPRTGLLSWNPEADARRRGDLADELIVVPPGSSGLTLAQQFRNRLKRLGVPVRSMTTAELALRQFGADVLFGTQVYPGVGAIPFLGWIPDFQYAHLPEVYGAEGAERVHRGAERIATEADRLLMSSETVKSDLARLFPYSAHKARVVSFVSPIPKEVYDFVASDICNEYHLPEKFFYVPNQFWAHKNHRLVLDALCSEPAYSADVVVVCSGNPHDSRNPTFFGEFLSEVSRRGMRSRMIILGYVPRRHVLYLMRQSVALLQPSKFEGWNTAIEEAKSLGKAVVASDIPVHREQNPPKGVYFKVDDAGDLSRVLAGVWRSYNPGPDTTLEEDAREALPPRMKAFAERFVEVAKETAECRPNW